MTRGRIMALTVALTLLTALSSTGAVSAAVYYPYTQYDRTMPANQAIRLAGGLSDGGTNFTVGHRGNATCQVAIRERSTGALVAGSLVRPGTQYTISNIRTRILDAYMTCGATVRGYGYVTWTYTA